MGSKGAKQQVTEYYMSMHQGIASSFDVLLKIIVKEKTAWSGYLSGLTLFNIDQPDLFGGVKKEGGVKGNVYFLPGAADQVLPDVLAQRLGRSGGADAPGYRGLASLFFVGDTHRGFYWTANNPYLPGIWATGRRAPVGLTEAYALIPRPTSDFFPYEQRDSDVVDTTGQQWMVSGNGQWMSRCAGTFPTSDVETWSLSTLTSVSVSEVPSSALTAGSAMSIDDNGSTWVMRYADVPPGPGTPICLLENTAGGTVNVTQVTSGPNPGRPTYCLTTSEGLKVYVGTTTDGYFEFADHHPDAWPATAFCADDILQAWALLTPTGSSNQFELRNLTDPSDGPHILTSPVTRSGAPNAGVCYSTLYGHFFILLDGHLLTVDKATFTVTDHGAAPTSNFLQMPFNRPSARSMWDDNREYSLEDGSLIRTISIGSYVPNESGFSGLVYDPLNNALITGVNASPARLDWYFLDRGDLDANPAHMIYEALTNTDWGMGSPSTLIDVDSFEDAGVVLFNEPLGLSMIWTRQSSIQDFIQEVLDHIQAALFVDPQTGLLTLKLIRGDYDVGTLPTIDPSNATINNFGRKLWGEIVNEISVTWTNPENEQDETVTVHDLASITTQGGVISDSRNYYGVRYAQLAQRLAARDLRSAGAPLAACDAEVDRTMWLLRPASVVLLDWPEYGLVGLVMRVTSIDYGKPGDPTLKISLIEDVFGLDAGDYVDPPSTSWEDPASPPTAMDEQEALTLPYYMAKNAVTSIEGAAYPEVLAGALGASSNADAYGFELWGEVTLPDGSTEWQSLASLNILGHAELVAGLDAEAASTGVTFTSYIGAKRPQQAGFAIIGAAGEEGNELALITAAGGSTASLSRGVLDTVPKAWPAGTPVWFIDGDALFEDPDARSVGEVVEYQLRTRTSQGILLAAPILTATLSDRPWLPSRPAKVEIDSVMFNDSSTPVDMIGEIIVPVTWANRNRLLEVTVVLDWTDATVTPEDGQTTTINVLKTDGVTVVDTITGLSGTSHNIPIASFGSEAIAIVELRASRTDDDGAFDSLQGHGVWVRVAYSSGVEGAGGIGAASFAGAMIDSGAFGASGSGALNGNSASSYTGAFGGSGAGALALEGAAVSSGPRYWRIIMREGGLITTIVSEIELRTSVSGSDVTGSGTASASLENVGEEASKAFDNNTSSYWQANSAAAGVWIKYDFGAGSGQAIVEVAMTANAGFPERMIRQFDVQSSPDDSVWTTEWSVDGEPAWTGGAQQVFTKPATGAARRWRLRADTLVSANTMSCAEMEMRASLGGADETGSGTASASTTFGGFPASNAFDNNTATLWSGNSGKDDCEWLAYDFGSGVTKSIVQISFTARNDASYTQSPTAGWIESGSDGISWIPRIHFSGLSWSAGSNNLIS